MGFKVPKTVSCISLKCMIVLDYSHIHKGSKEIVHTCWFWCEDGGWIIHCSYGANFIWIMGEHG